MTEGDCWANLDDLKPIPWRVARKLSRNVYCHHCDTMRDDAKLKGRAISGGHVVQCQACLRHICIREAL